MGEIRVSDETGEERHPTSRFEGTVELRLDENRHPTLVISEEAPISDQDVEVRVGDIGRDGLSLLGSRWAVLLVPALLGVATIALSESAVLARAHQGLAEAVQLALNAAIVLLGTTGTVRLYADARELTAGDADWSPSPWIYLVPGGLVVGAYAISALGASDPASLPSSVLAGIAFVSAALSSVPTGPIYVFNRYRTVGLG